MGGTAGGCGQNMYRIDGIDKASIMYEGCGSKTVHCSLGHLAVTEQHFVRSPESIILNSAFLAF